MKKKKNAITLSTALVGVFEFSLPDRTLNAHVQIEQNNLTLLPPCTPTCRTCSLRGGLQPRFNAGRMVVDSTLGFAPG